MTRHDMLNEQDYIYLRENLKTSAEDILNNSNVDGSTKPTTAQAVEVLKKVPMLDPSRAKMQVSKDPNFKRHYKEALGKLGEEAQNPIGDGIAVLYATTRSIIEKTNNPTLRSKLSKHLDRLFDTVWNHPGKLVGKGVKIWLVSFMMLFLFWWIPSAREILKGARQLAMVMIMIGLVFAIVKYFMKKVVRG